MVSAWLRDQPGGPISRLAIGRHRAKHLGLEAAPGRRPKSDSLLRDVRDIVHEAVAEGSMTPTLRDGLMADVELGRREERDVDRDWQLRLVAALTGRVAIVSPEVLEIEAEYRPLLGSGDGS
jgi:hypothetical protein